MSNKETDVFPESYPKNLLECIIEDGAAKNTYNEVYRVSETGLCNRDAFICTALQNEINNVNNRDSYLLKKDYIEKLDIGFWSTSCWNKLSRAKNIYRLKEKKEHSPSILKGNILPETGYSIVSKERLSAKNGLSSGKKGHIDWWIFKNIDVSQNFSIMEEF